METISIENIRKKPFLIKSIENPNIEYQFEAVKSNYAVIPWIKNINYSVLLYAVINDPLAIRYIAYPSIELIIESLKHEVNVLNIENKYIIRHFLTNKLPKDEIEYIIFRWNCKELLNILNLYYENW